MHSIGKLAALAFAHLAAAQLSVAAVEASATAAPDLWLLYTQDGDGFLRTCGCTGPAVGLAEAVQLTRQVRQQLGSRSIVLDAGNLASERTRGRVAWAAISAAGYDVWVAGAADEQWGTALWPIWTTESPAIVGLPRTDGGVAENAAVLERAGGVRIGVVRLPSSAVPPEPAAMGAAAAKLRTLRTGCDVLILVTHLTAAQVGVGIASGALAPADVVVGSVGGEMLVSPKKQGDTYMLPAARLGRELGAAHLYLTPRVAIGARPGVRLVEFARHEVTGELAGDRGVASALEHAITGEQRALLAQMDSQSVSVLRRKGYTEPARCAPCHDSAYQVWLVTGHSRATATLALRSSLRPECLPCHSQTYRLARYIDGARPGAGVECTSCHGDATLHLLVPRRGTVLRGGLSLCLDCHTNAADPAFGAARRWAAIRH